MAIWEFIGGQDDPETARLQVPGGWLVMVSGAAPGDLHASIAVATAFVPDPKHTWKVAVPVMDDTSVPDQAEITDETPQANTMEDRGARPAKEPSRSSWDGDKPTDIFMNNRMEFSLDGGIVWTGIQGLHEAREDSDAIRLVIRTGYEHPDFLNAHAACKDIMFRKILGPKAVQRIEKVFAGNGVGLMEDALGVTEYSFERLQ